MSKRARVEVGGSRWRRRNVAAAVVRVAVVGLIVAGGLSAGPGAGVATAQAPGADGAFTADQAASGWSAYGVQCSECHGIGLEGMIAPPLSGVEFLNTWAGQTTDELFEYLRDTMPPGAEGALSDQSYIDLVAYMLEANGALPGDLTLTADAAVMIGDAADISEARRAAQAGELPRRRSTRFVNQTVPHELTPVTDALLADPPPGDWLSWRRTRNGHGYSPLDQITRDNVGDLQLAWSISVRPGNHQTTPLVHDGVMFLASPGNVVRAIDAVTGDVIWVYRARLPDDARPGATRTLALYGDKLFLARADAVLVALDASTGEEVWTSVKTDYTQGFRQNAGPVIANGVVITGTNGCERYTEQTCFITGHDPDTGDELWRTSTIALPGDPNNASWGDTPPYLRAGGDSWIPGSYDSELGLFFIGTAQAKPWVASSRGMTTRQDALYTNSTLALNPRTGQVEWYFQHAPAETLDLDIVYERVLVDADGEQWLFTIGKDGILWKLDRRTGAFVDPPRDRPPGHLRVDRPLDRRADLPGRPAGHRHRRAGLRLPQPPRRPQLAGLGLSPRGRRPRHPPPPGVHAPDRPRGRVHRGRRRHRRPLRAARDARQQRQHWQARRLRRPHDGRAVEPRAARALSDVGPHHCRRPRFRRRRRPLLPRVRCRDRRGALGDPPRLVGARLPGHLRGGRSPVHRRPRRAGWGVPEPHREAQPGDLPARGRERALRVRFAGITPWGGRRWGGTSRSPARS